MSHVRVSDLARQLGMDSDRLLRQLKRAEVDVDDETSLVSDEDKHRLLALLRHEEGRVEAGGDVPAPNKITLKRKVRNEEIRQSLAGGRSRSVQVEVRKKRTFVRPEEAKPEVKPEVKHEEPAPEAVKPAVVEIAPVKTPVVVETSVEIPVVVETPAVEVAIEQAPVVEAPPVKAVEAVIAVEAVPTPSAPKAADVAKAEPKGSAPVAKSTKAEGGKQAEKKQKHHGAAAPETPPLCPRLKRPRPKLLRRRPLPAWGRPWVFSAPS